MARSAHGSGCSSLSDFKVLSLLGEGAYSAVYRVLRLADNETYALKKVKIPDLNDKEKSNALNEVRLIASVRHENVIAYKEAFFDGGTNCLCIVQECADAGDLLSQINRAKKDNSVVRETDIWRYLEGMCQGLRALHDLRILHRDLKSANVFLSSSSRGTIAKLGDFNVSKVAKRGLCMTQTGTPYYASPEVWRDMPYDSKSDMWSLGCVTYEVAALRPPFRAESMEGLYKKVVKGQYPKIPSHNSQDLSDIIGTLLQVRPADRPSAQEFLDMPLMRRRGPGLAPQTGEWESNLLGTIKVPKKKSILDVALPQPRYALPVAPVHPDSHLADGPGSLADSIQRPLANNGSYLVRMTSPVRGSSTGTSNQGTIPPSRAGYAGGQQQQPRKRRSAVSPQPPSPGDKQPQDALDEQMAEAQSKLERLQAGSPPRASRRQIQLPVPVALASVPRPSPSPLQGVEGVEDSLDAYIQRREAETPAGPPKPRADTMGLRPGRQHEDRLGAPSAVSTIGRDGLQSVADPSSRQRHAPQYRGPRDLRPPAPLFGRQLAVLEPIQGRSRQRPTSSQASLLPPAELSTPKPTEHRRRGFIARLF